MINSLSKDSHITQYSCRPLPYNSYRSMYKSTPSIVNKESCKINFKKSARNINFCGLSSYKLADSGSFQTLVSKAKTVLGESADGKTVKSFIGDSFGFARDGKKDVAENVKKFAKEQKSNISSLIEKTKKLMTDEHVQIDPENLAREKTDRADFIKTFWEDNSEEFEKNIETAVDKIPLMLNKKEGKSIHTNKQFQNFLKLADRSAAVFSAIFALGLTCILRPAAIMSLPGKKNKEDKIYAAGHSIASGIIGYLIALAIFNPISAGVGKIIKRPKHYLAGKGDYLIKDGRAMNVAQKGLTMLPETILAAPRATITIALIPPILKYVFGCEKKKGPASKDMGPILENYAAINFKSTNHSKKIAFQKLMEESK